MTSNGVFIPVILPNENIGAASGNSAPGLGHAGFIMVNQNGGATFYEYGPYQNSFVQGNSTVTTANPLNPNKANVREIAITGTMQFDSNGNITQASLKAALDQVFGSGSPYAGADPGMVEATPFTLTSASQRINITNSIQGFKDNITNSGLDATYSLLGQNGGPNCINFVYDMAIAGGLTISATQAGQGVSIPTASADGIVAQANGMSIPSYQYVSPSSWDASGGQSNIQAITSTANATYFEDAAVQFDRALASLGETAFSSTVAGIAWSAGQLANLGNGLVQWTFSSSSNGDKLIETLNGTQSFANFQLLNSSNTPLMQVAYNADGSDTFTGYNGSGVAQYTQVNNLLNGALSATITGTGDVATLSNAAISFAANAVATVTGNADAIAAAAGAAVTISGTGNTCNASNVTIVLADGAQCTVTGSHDTIILGSNASLVIDSLASYDVTTVTGSHTAIADYGAYDYDVIQGAFDTATVTGAGAGVNITGNNDNATLSGANAQAGASGTSDYIVLAGAYETDTLSGANDASLATGNNDQIAFTSTATNAQGGAYGNNDYISMAGLGDVATLTGIGDSALETGVNEQLVFTSTASNAFAGAYGNNDYISLQGAGDQATLTGTNDSAYAYGNNDILTFTATAAYANVGASGASDYLVLQGNNDQATLIGSGDAANASGNYDTLTFTSTAANGQAAASGLSDIINFSGLSDIATMTGVGDTANLSGAYDHASGTGNTETINMDGLADMASLTGMYETVNSTRTGETINLSASNGSWDAVYGSGDQLNLDTQVALVLNGSSDNIAGAYDLMRFSGQYNILNTNYSVINDFNAVGDYLTGWYDVYNGGNPGGFYNGPDPIVLNLDGQKVQTVGITDSNAFFDVRNDGQKILTGWAAAGEGLLMYDPKNTSRVTSEASLVSSFAELDALDDNRDGVLDSQDSAWSQLKVWVDKAGIGNFDSESLFSLDKLGISSISLKASQTGQESNGNTIVADSTFTWKDGRTGDIAGVTFATAPDVTMGANDEGAVNAHAAYTKLVSVMATGDAGQIAAAQREFNASTSSFQGTVGASTVDTAATEPNDKLSTGSDAANTYLLNETGVSVVKDTATGLDGKTIQNFSTLDGIDLTSVLFSAHPTLGFSEDASNTFGTLTVSDGTHAAAILLLGQYSAANFQTVSDGGTGTLVAMAGTANLTAILAAAHG